MIEHKPNDHESLRINPRALLTRPVTIQTRDQSIEHAAMVDISVSGAKIKISSNSLISLKAKDTFAVFWSVVPGTHQLQLQARLKWIDKKTGILGLEWVQLSLIARKIISRLVFFHRS